MAEDKPELYVYLPRLILNKLEEQLGDMFHAYFDGEPVLIGSSHLPALIVEWENSTPVEAPTRHDKWSHQIIIKVLVNKMDDAGMPDTVGQSSRIIEVPTKKKLERFIFARDATTGQYIDKCIMGVLRRNFTMQGSMSTQIINQLQFGNSRRPQLGTGDNIVTSEAHLRISARELIQVPNRT